MLGKNGITNAITHRNYAISGEHTKIFIYDDRMEILSPGDLPGIVTMDLGQVFRHIFLRIFINYSSFAGAVDINIKENL